ncbi:hypothetical protein TNCV_4860151 [Trichonephila clavipes]|nr:hypothetical protein TNCV_4860151 [Trichonephila clavipes]
MLFLSVGFIKDCVFVPLLPADFPDLKHRIQAAVARITLDTVNKVWDELTYRFDVCRERNGAHIEHLDVNKNERKSYHNAASFKSLEPSNFEGLRARRRGNGAHKCTSESIDQRISQLTIRDSFSTVRDIRSQWLPGAGESVLNQPCSRLLEVQLRVWVPVTGVLMTAKHLAKHLAWCHRRRTWTIE